TAIRIQVMMCRAIQMTSSRIPTAIAIPSTARIVVARNRTRRSSTSEQDCVRVGRPEVLHEPLVAVESGVLLDGPVDVLRQPSVVDAQPTSSVGKLVSTLLF